MYILCYLSHHIALSFKIIRMGLINEALNYLHFTMYSNFCFYFLIIITTIKVFVFLLSFAKILRNIIIIIILLILIYNTSYTEKGKKLKYLKIMCLY